MKPRHVSAERNNAIHVLRVCGIHVGESFHALNGSQVSALLVEADLRRYQQPRNANGSRARYFHDMLQRRAQRV